MLRFPPPSLIFLQGWQRRKLLEKLTLGELQLSFACILFGRERTGRLEGDFSLVGENRGEGRLSSVNGVTALNCGRVGVVLEIEVGLAKGEVKRQRPM